MQILIDSGATKSEFLAISQRKVVHHFQTTGINANYATDAEIEEVYRYAKEQLSADFEKVREIKHYGAGCLRESNVERVSTIIRNIFPMATVEIFSDLLIPCHALCRNESGVVGILGTGAAVCHYDGEKITRIAPSLGYMLGDEGSGIDLGKRFLKAYLSQQLSTETSKDFEKWLPIEPTQIIPQIYNGESPRKFFSSVAPFLSENINNQEIKNICKNAFSDFFRFNKAHFPDKELPWYLSGSIAFHFQDLIAEVAEDENILLQKIIQKPLEEIILCYQ